MLLGTLAHVLTNEAAIRSFLAIAAVLKPGGLFVLELASPEDLFDGAFALGDAWDATAEGGQKLVVEYGTEGDEFDSISQARLRVTSFIARHSHDVVLLVIHSVCAACLAQVVQRTVKISTVQDDGGYSLLLEDSVAQRLYTYQEIDLLARITGFEVVGLHGALDLQVGLDSEDSYALVICLKKK